MIRSFRFESTRAQVSSHPRSRPIVDWSRKSVAPPNGTGFRPIFYALAAYVVVLAGCAAWRWHIWTYGADTGTFTQVIADAFGGFHDGPEQGTHFRFHWAPLLASLWPLLAAGRSGLVLQVVQPLLIGVCALPLYGIARNYVPERRAFAYAGLALLYPPLVAVAFTEFHEIAFYPALALALFWAAERARWRWFIVFAILGALVREEACIVLAIVGLVFATIGIAHALASRQRTAHEGDGARVSKVGPGERIEHRLVADAGEPSGLLGGEPREAERLAAAGLFLALVNVVALVVYSNVVLARVGPWQPSRFYEYPFAHGPANVIAALVVHPAYLAQIATLGRLTYILEALVPLAFLPLFSRWSLLALPGFAVVLLASDPIAWRMGSHYAAIWCPWLLLGALAVLVRRDFRRGTSPNDARETSLSPATSSAERGRGVPIWYRAAFTLSVIVLLVADPAHPAHYLRPIYPHADAERALALVPRNAHLLTHDEWFTHVAYTHRNATVFFCPYIDYVVYADDYPNAYYHDEIVPELARERASGRIVLLATLGRVHVYRRTPNPGARVGLCITPGNVRYQSLPQALRDGVAPPNSNHAATLRERNQRRGSPTTALQNRPGFG